MRLEGGDRVTAPAAQLHSAAMAITPGQASEAEGGEIGLPVRAAGVVPGAAVAGAAVVSVVVAAASEAVAVGDSCCGVGVLDLPALRCSSRTRNQGKDMEVLRCCLPRR
jgi:hypothetical protein